MVRKNNTSRAELIRHVANLSLKLPVDVHQLNNEDSEIRLRIYHRKKISLKLFKTSFTEIPRSFFYCIPTRIIIKNTDPWHGNERRENSFTLYIQLTLFPSERNQIPPHVQVYEKTLSLTIASFIAHRLRSI